MINIISNLLEKSKINHLIITGQMTVHKREKTIQQFRDDPLTTALILSIKASSTGLNLTMANNVLIVDPWWNVI